MTRHPSHKMCRFRHFLSHGNAFAGRDCGLCKCAEIFTSQPPPRTCFIQESSQNPSRHVCPFAYCFPSGFGLLLTLQLLLETDTWKRRRTAVKVSSSLFSSRMDGCLRLYSGHALRCVSPLLSDPSKYKHFVCLLTVRITLGVRCAGLHVKPADSPSPAASDMTLGVIVTSAVVQKPAHVGRSADNLNKPKPCHVVFLFLSPVQPFVLHTTVTTPASAWICGANSSCSR